MNNGSAVVDATRPTEVVETSTYRELVRHASLAASSHNTQPWKFRIDSESISILPDFSRRCPVVDPDDHHLFVSLGWAAENLLIAAEAAGLHGQPLFDPSRDGGTIRIALEKATPSRSPFLGPSLTGSAHVRHTTASRRQALI